jgi:CheY-like chemotaxis protein
MAGIAYLDFDLSIQRAGDGYRAQVVKSPDGETVPLDFTLPFSQVERDNYLLRLGPHRRGTRRANSPDLEVAEAFGRELFKAVFRDELLSCLSGSLAKAVAQDAGLRIRLRLTQAPELADLPWEYLYYPAQNYFLALSVGSPIVRYLEMPQQSLPLAVTPPLRVLVMIAHPNGYQWLDVEAEWRNLREALGDLERKGLVALERLPEATETALRRQLRQGEYHIFHFIGHGSFDRDTDSGVLVMEDEHKQGRLVSGQRLGMLFRDHRSLRLAIINACEGAVASRSDPFAGTAQSLAQQGLPAVIAMQFEITDEAAIMFAREFYTALADSYPVDAASTEARKAMPGVEWGTPVLYLRAPDGHIFNVEPVASVAPVAPIAPVANDEAPGGQAQPAVDRKRILVVEDEENQREVIRLILTDERGGTGPRLYEVQTANSGLEALRLFKQERFDLVLTDLKMPGMDGIQLLNELTQLDSSLRVIFVTAHGSIETVKDALRQGASDFLEKPLNRDKLLEAVSRALATEKLSAPPPEPEPKPKPKPEPVIVPSLAPSGAMDPRSPLYVERLGEQSVLEYMREQGVTLTITGPRQTGGSSLLHRIVKAAERAEKRVIHLDFQQAFGSEDLTSSDVFFRHFCLQLTFLLGEADRVDDHWKAPGSNVRRCTLYVEYLLRSWGKPLVLAIDEVDRLLDTRFRSDFFGMLRSWHNARAISPNFKNLDLVLVTTVDPPERLIDDPHQSPFNVGEVFPLTDFTQTQAEELNRRYGSPLKPAELKNLMALIGGHPYLTQLALHQVAKGIISVDQLKSDGNDGPFARSLSNYLSWLRGSDELLEGMKEALRHNNTKEAIFQRLRSVGLVRREGRKVLPRCQLYENYFREHLL